ncbi:helix-turn-helix domain-containing protein [Actinoallomurus spadix]|uniref:HTH cro/C1-type domain-containing protein n=1 Tax=Actinoallomurus spadix TaxID=79912 RepID=A0ABP3GNL0_9ACTN|nr:helix-turn-helix transcriptional regulator [Actinoallomurus spadix]MCO5986548.1 helix-turn-helix domain-containing protein [Actinoallomurus spadix]
MTTPTRQRRKINPHALQALRARERLTQARLAGLAGVDHTTVSRLERGERYTLPVEVIDRFAEALKVPATALYAAD